MNDSAADAPVPRPTVSTVPKWVNPWVISFVLGALAITLTRSKTRHVPDAPPVLAAAPAVLTSPSGLPDAGRGVRLYGFIGPGDAGTATLAALESLSAKFVAAEAPVTVIALPANGIPVPKTPGVLALPLAPESLDAVTHFLGVTAKHLTVPSAEPWGYGLLLVDSTGGFRGFFSIAEWGVDEVLHRAQHVIREEQKR